MRHGAVSVPLSGWRRVLVFQYYETRPEQWTWVEYNLWTALTRRPSDAAWQNQWRSQKSEWGEGARPLPLPFPYIFLPSFPLYSLPPYFRSIDPLNPAKEHGGALSAPPATIEFGALYLQNMRSGGNNFNYCIFVRIKWPNLVQFKPCVLVLSGG